MGLLLTQAVEKFREVVAKHGVPLDAPVFVEPLGVKEALGDPAPYVDFALQRGEERLLDASFDGAHGQAFTSNPSRWHGTLGDILSMTLDGDRERALVTATMNAVCRRLGLLEGTVHCKDKGPEECGGEMAQALLRRFGDRAVVGIVGYQPAILRHVAAAFSPARVRVVDLNPENVGRTVDGVPVWHGERDFDRFVAESTVGLSTGSTIINSSADGIYDAFQKAGKPVLFFGTSIAGPAALLGLERLCFRAM